MPPIMLRSLRSLVLVALALSPIARADDEPSARFAVNVVLNGDFELAADTSVSPAKYGSYWKNAFEYAKGTSTSQISELAPGQHAARLEPGRDLLRQALTLYGPYADRFALRVRVKRPAPEVLAHVLVRSGVDFDLHYVLGDKSVVPDVSTKPIQLTPIEPPDADGFATYRLEVGRDFASFHKARPGPWVEIQFGAERGVALIDDVVGTHWLPRVSPHELRAMLLDEIRTMLWQYFGAKDGQPRPGLEFVDPTTGYQVVGRYDCNNGKPTQMESAVGIAGIHEIALRYCHVADDAPDAEALRTLLRTRLRTHLESLLRHNVFPSTQLYTFVDPKTFEPKLELAVAPSHYIHHTLDVAALFPEDAALAASVRERVLAMADALVRIRAQHDLPHTVQFGRDAGGNWFGRMPEKFHPDGRLDQPRTYNQAWAISQNRSWYYDFQTAHGLMRAWSLEPKEEYLQTALGAIARFDRKFDAQRFDLENDTDDHYGFNVESLLKAYDASGRKITAFLDTAQTFTDYRLPRDAAWDANLWIEGVRLGSFCAGDQPRAFRGPTGLYLLDSRSNPATSGFEPYLFAVRELARGDMKHRLLDDGFTQDASGFMWTMISACFKSDFIGPCSMNLKWEGDMGDLFAGPASNGFRALARGIEIGGGGGMLEFTAWYATVFDHTMALFRKPFGYRYGMSVETGKRYGIPERYLEGFSDDNPYGIGCVLVHADLVESGALDVELPRLDGIEAAAAEDGNVAITVRGPAGAGVRVRAATRESPRQLGVVDWRLRWITDPAAPSATAVLDAAGAARVVLPLRAKGRVLAEAELDANGPFVADLVVLERTFE